MTEDLPLHTLVFDLDDTLYPERDFVASGFRAVDLWLKECHGIQCFHETAGKIFEQGRRGRIFDEALLLLGIEPKAELVAGMVTAYRVHEPRIGLFPDAQEILGWAAPRFRLGLITDGYGEVQAGKIRALGLDKTIDCRVITDEIGREFWKPSPEPYRRVMDRLSGPAEGYLYVGDNAHKDFIGARSLGWRTARIRRPLGDHSAYAGGPAESADHEIQSLLELKKLVFLKRTHPY